MKVRIRVFASAREIIGRGTLDIEAPSGATAGDVFELLSVEYPRLRAYGPHLALAANAEYVTRDHALQDGDELALVPPVSGGHR